MHISRLVYLIKRPIISPGSELVNHVSVLFFRTSDIDFFKTLKHGQTIFIARSDKHSLPEMPTAERRANLSTQKICRRDRRASYIISFDTLDIGLTLDQHWPNVSIIGPALISRLVGIWIKESFSR